MAFEVAQQRAGVVGFGEQDGAAGPGEYLHGGRDSAPVVGGEDVEHAADEHGGVTEVGVQSGGGGGVAGVEYVGGGSGLGTGEGDGVGEWSTPMTWGRPGARARVSVPLP